MPLQTREMPLREIQRESNGVGPGIEADQAKVAALMKKAKSAVEEGHPRAALEILQKAAKIQKTEKILKRIAKLEAYLAENGSEDEDEEDDNMVHVGKGFYVFKDLYNRLYEYQKESLLWFWRLHRKQKGGILGDDMGLGKTVQVVAFLSGLFDMEQVENVLIVVPVALVINWEREFKNWAPGIGVHTFHGASKKERERLLERVQRRGGVLMVSYGLVMTCWEQINHYRGNDFVWDYVMLDEGHKIKNPTKTTKAANAIAAKHRFILTGTPIQNNLKELWSLFNFVTHGTLLGTLQTFKSEYDNPITRAREKDATASEKLLGNEMAESLRLLIAPYFLRRTKADVIKNKKEDSEQNDGDSEASGSTRDGESLSPEVLIPSLTRKNDLIVWLSLTETQIQIYKDFISLDRVKELLMTKRSPLAELTILKKICDHPRLLSNRACRQLGLQMSEEGYDENDDPSEMECAANSVHAISEETLFLESGKLQFLVKLLTNLKEEKHRCLVFSQSRKMLDIIEKILKARGFKLMRLDGTITKMSDREDRISRFQRDYSYSVFLLTTQVGGVGLTLTGANRVVIIDPSWNPATDNQAVDRAYRIGQTRSVVIYRLITCGTVEEKIYRRQVFKESLTKQATGGSKNPYRYFTGQQLKELFVLDDPSVSQTQMQLEAMHSSHRKTDTLLDAHIAFLYSAAIFGISDHDLMFSQEAHVEPDQEYEEEGNQYIQQRVQRAQDLVAQESDLTRKLNDHIQRGTEGPGGAKKRYSMNVNRERLQNEWAEKTGEGVINPPLQHVPKHYKPEDRPPPRGANIAVQDLDRTMEELTLDESGASLGEEAEDLAHRSPGYQSDASEASEEEEEEVVIIDESPPGSGGEECGGSRPGSVFVVDDDSRPGSRLEDSSRPGSRVEDKAFIGESYLPEDSRRGCSRNATYDDDHVANSKRDQDEEMEDYIDDHSSAGDFQSDPEGSRGEEGLEKSADESLELVVGMTPPNRPNGSSQDHCEESSRDMTSFDTGATHGDIADGSGSLRSRGKESKHMMPSDTDSYGTMEVSSGQPSDLPYFNATRKLSLGESRSLTFSRQSSQDEEAEFRANTIEWENGQCSSQSMRSGSLMGERRRDQDVSMSAADDVELDSEDDEEGGSYGEVVEVSISSFCCQAGGDVSQDMDVSIGAGTANSNKDHQSGLQTGPVPMVEDEKDSVLDEDSESSEKSPHSNLQEDEVEDEESYEDVSMASFSVQTDDVDDQSSVQSTNPEDKLNSPLNKNSSLEDQQSPQEERSSTTFADGREGPPGGIDLDATSRFLGLTSEESPFLDTSSPVTKARHVRRIVSDDEEGDEDESVFERDVGSGSRGRFLDDEGQRRRSDKEKGRRDGQLSAKRKKPSSVLVDDSDEEEEDIRKSSRTTKSSLDTDQSDALQDSMDDFIVGDSDEEQSLDEPSLNKNAIIDESLLDDSEESPSEEKEEDEEDEEEEEEEEEVGRKRRKKHVIVSDDEDDDDDEGDEGDDEGDDDVCISKPDKQHLKSGKNSYFIEMEAADGRSASHDTGRVSDEEGETKDSEEHLELEEEEMVEEDEEDEVEDSDDCIIEEEEEEEGDEEEGDEGEEEEEEEEEEESDENGSEDEADLEMREKYKALVKKGMSKISEGDNKGALRAFLQALYIDGSSEQLQLIALKLKKKLESQ